MRVIKSIVLDLLLLLCTAVQQYLTIPLNAPKGFADENGYANISDMNVHNSWVARKYETIPKIHESNSVLSSQASSLSEIENRALRDGQLPLTPCHSNTLFHFEVVIGSNPVAVIAVVPDTGSSDLTVVGPDCTKDENCRGRKVYDPRMSKTADMTDDIANGKSFIMRYGTNAVEDEMTGTQHTDYVFLNGFLVKDQVVSVVGKWGGNKAKAKFFPDGTFGFGFPETMVNGPRETFIQRLYRQGDIRAPVISFVFGETSSTSQLSIGFVNDELKDGEITYFPVIGRQHHKSKRVSYRRWIIAFEGFSVNQVKIHLKGLKAVIDTGASMIHATRSVVTEFYRNVPHANPAPHLGPGLWTIPCSDIPWVTLKFGRRRFYIHPSRFWMGYADGENCIGGLAEAEFDTPEFDLIVGLVFLRNVVSVFDFGSGDQQAPRIGFAAMAGVPPSASSVGSSSPASGLGTSSAPQHKGKL